MVRSLCNHFTMDLSHPYNLFFFLALIFTLSFHHSFQFLFIIFVCSYLTADTCVIDDICSFIWLCIRTFFTNLMKLPYYLYLYACQSTKRSSVLKSTSSFKTASFFTYAATASAVPIRWRFRPSDALFESWWMKWNRCTCVNAGKI